jgi:regulator of cell morphogenesis and NO signaling
MAVNEQTTVGDLVKERPQRSRIFEEYQIDYCCGGGESLADACAKRGLDPQAVLWQIEESDSQPAAGETELVDADAMSLTDLADHIEQTHHQYMKSELPRLDAMTQKVHEVHGESDVRLADGVRARQRRERPGGDAAVDR